MVSKYTCSPEVLFKADCLLAVKWESGSLKHTLWLPSVCVFIYTQYIYFDKENKKLLQQSKHIAPCVQMSARILIQYYIAFVIMNYFICIALLCHCKHRNAIHIFFLQETKK